MGTASPAAAAAAECRTRPVAAHCSSYSAASQAQCTRHAPNAHEPMLVARCRSDEYEFDDGSGEEDDELNSIMDVGSDDDGSHREREGGIDDDAHSKMLAAATGKRQRARGHGGRGDRRESEALPAVADYVTEAGAENEYAVRRGGDGGGGGGDGGGLTAADLVASLDDSVDVASLKKRVGGEGRSRARQSSAAASQPLSVPLSSQATARVERGVAYEATVRAVSSWEPTVKRNREATQLRFNDERGGGRKRLTTGAMTDAFQATSSLETEIEAILEETGLGDTASVAAKEEGALASKMLTKEEVMERQNELKRRRNLMFHQEMKLKRVKKIKSRKFRKLAKRQKEKDADEVAAELREAGGEAAEEARLKEERAHARERMTLRHKNNSKWVKRQLALGRNTAASEASRSAIAEQLRLGEKLRRKATGEKSARQMEDEELDDEEATERWLEKTRAEMAASAEGSTNLWADADAGAAAVAEGEKGLLGMSFMKKAAVRKQKEVQAILDELEAEGEGQEDEEDQEGSDEDEEAGQEVKEGGAGGSSGQARQKAKKSSAAAPVGEKVGGAASRRRIGGGGGGGGGGGEKHWADAVKGMRTSAATVTQMSDSVAVAAGDWQQDDAQGRSLRSRTRAATATAAASPSPASAAPLPHTAGAARKEGSGSSGGDSDVNPWIGQHANAATVAAGTVGSKPRQKRKLAQVGGHEAATASAAAPTTLGVGDATSASSGASKQSEPSQSKRGGDGKRAKRGLTQEELVARAFVTGGQEEDFEEAKEALVSELERREVEKDLPKVMKGWGEWTGQGVKKRKRPTAFELALEAKKAARRANRKPRQDDGLRHVLINEKKNWKTMKYEANSVPHGFSGSQSIYEASIRHPLGRDWSTAAAYKARTQPAVLTRAGLVIAPIKKTKGSKKQTKRRPLTR